MNKVGNRRATARVLALLLPVLVGACGASGPASDDGMIGSPSPLAKRHSRGEDPLEAAERPLHDTLSWYDGARKRRIWVDPEVLVETEPGDRGGDLVRRHAPGAAELPGSRRARRWRLASGDGDSRETARALAEADPRCRFSPAFHDAASDRSDMRALTGRILVRFRDEWSEEDVSAWIAARGFLSSRKLPIGRHVRVLEAGSGLDALETANRIHETEDVIWCSPEWSRALSPR